MDRAVNAPVNGCDPTDLCGGPELLVYHEVPMYLIRDKAEGPQRLPLALLLERIAELKGSCARWRISKTRGYGEQICDLEDRVLREDSVLIDADEVIRLANDPQQWFYDLACSTEDGTFFFGVLDSGALFLSGDDDLVRRLLVGFREVAIEPWSGSFADLSTQPLGPK
jgi:hypothetical protein